MKDQDTQRWARLNLPHARTVLQRVGRSLEALGAFGEAGDGHAAPLAAAFDAVEQRLRGFDEELLTGEDTDFAFRAHLKGVPVLGVPVPSKALNGMDSFSSVRKIVRKQPSASAGA